jgi:hypothetical protein
LVEHYSDTVVVGGSSPPIPTNEFVMRRKIIFIDVDGPLAWGTWGDGRVTLNETNKTFTIPYPWVEEDCQVLQKICDETNSSLVVSSDWKKHFSIIQLKRIFQYYGVTAPIVDITTHQDLWNKLSRPSIEWERAAEITKWVKDNKISNWISIDDMKLDEQYKWMKPRVPKWRHVQVDGDWGQGGRLRDKIDECIKKLER